MRVCIFVDSQNMGGIEAHILQSIQGLIENSEYCIDLLFWQDYHKLKESKHPILTALEKLPLLYHQRCRYLTANSSLQVLYRYLKKEQPILHTHGYKAGILARLLSLFTRTPVISTYHNGDPGKGRIKFYNKLDIATSFLSTNIAVNNSISLSIKNCTVISNFVDTASHTLLKQQSQTRKNIAFVGRVSHEKGPDIFAHMTENMNLPAAIYGDGPMIKILKDQYLHINYKGMCDMNDHWQDIKVLVMPSRYEGLPLAALEAMARGIPVIASEAGSLPELINNCGIGEVISLNDTQKYQEAVNHIIEQKDHKYIEQGKRLITYINNNFSRRTSIPKIIEQYQQASKHYNTIS